ncbi:hypothetical protein [Futiania mangrovi]|uniref:Uncharacterized protein n=1 Tax=Futiania mangrovi TaxID=2959716 RepID=A0A9J6P7T6_9PROT|nr:hypothetical protein [Futiania mangrovii]MCP1335156.1 hypothetical protein [Futiania mangrovii]
MNSTKKRPDRSKDLNMKGGGIERILRKAVGLPESTNSGDKFERLRIAVARIDIASSRYGKFPNPKETQSQIRELIDGMQSTIKMLSAMDSEVIISCDARDPFKGQHWAGLTGTTSIMLIRMETILKEISERVDAQVDIQFSGRNRPPNLRARFIAFELAQYLKDETGKMPGFTWNAEKGVAYGQYGKTLHQLFHHLDVQADLRAPAKWALEHLRKQETSDT